MLPYSGFYSVFSLQLTERLICFHICCAQSIAIEQWAACDAVLIIHVRSTCCYRRLLCSQHQFPAPASACCAGTFCLITVRSSLLPSCQKKKSPAIFLPPLCYLDRVVLVDQFMSFPAEWPPVLAQETSLCYIMRHVSDSNSSSYCYL